ncbi:alpha-L-fucosidase [Sphingomonas sp. OK281]|uniref:alpha-L-fucosidase n=1 Tax=Sphingomonas sp. OK281 TaxID=1881067 RepID=UPI0008E32D34|nr:alpha-L-fucosidase [Sphingomonas sp. OK281]SFN70728.1 alpha-L-fucosidase [Sphingomonas sp. OK281]
MDRRMFIAGAGAGVLASAAPASASIRSTFFKGNIPEGPFQPYWESLKAYECPSWFRDAKFGIWAHWSPQCVPEQGDWYARNMYIQGMPQNVHHVKTYGHPSRFGYKDICNLWKAERWDPAALVSLYKKAGAEYLVALATHHDNFDCWDSAYQPWNCTQIGPKRDIVGTWAKEARGQGLKFGVSYHGTPHRTWDEFLPVRYKSDTTGPMAGVQYDGVLTKADGKGQWWEGRDPRQLNGTPHLKGSPSPGFVREFLLRVQDVIDRYDPDVLTFDDGVKFNFDAGGPAAPDLGVWLGIPDLAPQIIAYYYNRNMQRRGGTLQGVVDLKEVPEPVWGALTRDFEMLMADKLEAEPWQTEACIGDWHYDRNLFQRHAYKTPSLMIPLFVDIVSKNGNLLLSIPLPGHGEPDTDEVAFLTAMAEWQAINGEGIKGSRPWKIYGEGPSTVAQPLGGNYKLEQLRFDHRDIRFTTKGDALYAFALGWPADGKILIRALREGSEHHPRAIARVEMLGSNTKVDWTRTRNGLEITTSGPPPSRHAVAFRIHAA